MEEQTKRWRRKMDGLKVRMNGNDMGYYYCRREGNSVINEGIKRGRMEKRGDGEVKGGKGVARKW